MGLIMVFLPILILIVPLLFEGTIDMWDFLFSAFVVLVLAFGYLTMVYEINHLSGILVLKIGFSSKKIRIKKIIRIEETNSAMSGYAFSLDRLEIFYDRCESVLVSPKEKEQFIQELMELNSSIVFKPKK